MASEMEVVLWVCPGAATGPCGNYYGSSSTHGKDLSQEMNTDLKGKPTHPRSQCPDCGAQRRRVRVQVPLPERVPVA